MERVEDHRGSSIDMTKLHLCLKRRGKREQINNSLGDVVTTMAEILPS